MSTGIKRAGQKPVKHHYKTKACWPYKDGALDILICPGNLLQAPSQGGATGINQIANANGTTQLIPDNAIPNLDFCNVNNWMLHNGATAYATTYTFTVSSANATVGATYTNSGHTYTVVGTIAGATTLVCTGTADPAASGTLTKSGGTGDATITYSAFVSAVSTLVLQYSDGTVIATINLLTAGTANGYILPFSSGVTLGTGFDSSNAPTGKGIQAVMTNATLGSTINVLLDCTTGK